MSSGNPFQSFAFRGALARQPNAPVPECNSVSVPRSTPNNTKVVIPGDKRRGGQAKRKRHTSKSPLAGEQRGLPEKLGQAPLRLILIGHNPSEHAWHTGHYYSNPSNRMWGTLIKTGIAPAGTTGCEADDSMPEAVGVGFTDVGSGQPGTDSSTFTTADFQRWRSDFYSRLQQHVAQASNHIGCTCGQCGAPAIVAFTGKRHYMELLNLNMSGKPLKGKFKVSPATVQLGSQPPNQLPSGWPLPADRCEVWVLTSTSGAAPMSNADREAPYAQLADRLKQIPWPRSDIHLHCTSAPAGSRAGNATGVPASG
eukprot:GHUV01026156.1.p1 GENE.GHUV01026156.1~~GHUV01026156.1.p1  ORF type:complete len:311 (+),score=70.48 GHUV01026156.1:99-1031(+)